MCGIVGLLVKNPGLRGQLGELMLPMLLGLMDLGETQSTRGRPSGGDVLGRVARGSQRGSFHRRAVRG